MGKAHDRCIFDDIRSRQAVCNPQGGGTHDYTANGGELANLLRTISFNSAGRSSETLRGVCKTSPQEERE